MGTTGEISSFLCPIIKERKLNFNPIKLQNLTFYSKFALIHQFPCNLPLIIIYAKNTIAK